MKFDKDILKVAAEILRLLAALVAGLAGSAITQSCM